MLKVAALLFVIAQAAAPQDIRPGEILDLTKRVVQVPPPGSAGHGWARGVRGMVEGQPPLALPLRVQIEIREPERNQFSVGDTLTCDVVLANPGDKPVTIPWSTGLVDRPETPEEADAIGYQEADVAFLVLDGAGRRHVIDGVLVDSVPSQPGTSRAIQPGEAVAIRASFRLGMLEEGSRAVFGGLPSGTAADVRLVASFYLYPYGYESGISENNIPIRLAPLHPQPSK
jgi:hypothetical protein